MCSLAERLCLLDLTCQTQLLEKVSEMNTALHSVQTGSSRSEFGDEEASSLILGVTYTFRVCLINMQP